MGKKKQVAENAQNHAIFIKFGSIRSLSFGYGYRPTESKNQ